MKKFLLFMVLLCYASITWGQAGCATALALTPGVEQCGNSAGMVGDFPNDGSAPTNPCNSSYNDDEYWFSYTPAAPNTTLELNLDSIDMTWAGIFVFDGCAGTGACVASATNGSVTTPLLVNTPTLAMGTTYYVVITSFGTPDNTSFCLNSAVGVPPPPPACATVVSPGDLSVDNTLVPIFEFMLDSPATTNYHVLLGEAGGTLDTVLNNEVTGAQPERWAFFNLDTNTTYEWLVIPFNAGGPAIGCSSFRFTTQGPPPSSSGITCGSGNLGVIFEEDFSAAIPAGWTGDIALSGNELWNMDGSGTTPSTNTGPGSAFSGTHYAFFESSVASGVNDTAHMITSAIDLSASTDDVQLDFQYHSFIFSFNLPNDFVGSLGVSASSDSLGPWTPIEVLEKAYSSNINEPWRPVSLNLGSSFNGGDLFVRFTAVKQLDANFNVDMAIDLVQVSTCQSCPDPNGLMASNITDVGADLSWIDAASSGLWDLEIDTAGFTPTGVPTVALTSDNPYTWAGGMQNTAYEFYVRSACNEGSTFSGWAGPFAFTTACGSQLPEYCQGFELFPLGQMNGAQFDCWSNTNSTNPEWVAEDLSTGSGGTGPTGPNTGSTYLFLETSSPAAEGDADTLTGPPVDISGLTTAQLSFFYHMHGGDMGTLRTEASDDGGATWTFVDTLVGEQQALTDDPWLERTVDISAFSSPVMIRFIGIRGAGFESDMALDDICVKETPLCPDPTLLMASNATTTTVDLTWTPGGSETDWIVSYGPLGNAPGSGTTMAVTDDSLHVMGLMAGTFYTAHVRAFCNPDSSEWISVDFSTLFANDTCSEAVAIACDDTVLFNNSGSRSFSGPTCVTSTGSFGLWYAFTGDGSEVTVSTDNPGTDHDTKLLVYTGGCDTLDCVTGDDDGGTGTTSVATFISEVGREYLIYACGFGTASGNIELTVSCVACYSARDLTISGITSDQGTAAWTTNPSSTGFALEYGLAGFALGSGTTITTGTAGSIDITGLIADTEYDVYVYETCGGVNTDTIGPVAFSTLCAAFTAPYCYGFEGTTTGDWDQVQVDCWNNTSSARPEWVREDLSTASSDTGPDSAAIGTMYAFLETSGGSLGDTDTLNGPMIDISGLTNAEFSFYYHMYGADMGELHYEISDDAGATWTSLGSLLGQQQDSTDAAWEQEVVDISLYTGTIMLRFVGVRGDGFTSDMSIDEICVDSGSAPCNPVELYSGPQTSGSYYASTSIISTATIATPEVVLYSAGTDVTLNGGFEVELGAEFDAVIGPCP